MEPKCFTAGTSVLWQREDSYAYGLWNFEYIFTGPVKKTVTASVSDGVIQVALNTEESNWDAGKYRWFLFRRSSIERKYIDAGYLTVLENPAALDDVVVVDHRSHAEKVLAAIEARIEGRISSDHESYTVDGRSLNRIPIEQLMQYRIQYRNEVAREQRVNSDKKPPRRVVYRMS